MRCAMKIVLPIVAALLCIGPSQAQQCTSGCSRSLPTKVAPKVDSTYVYELQAKTVLTPRDTQKVTIKADAEVGIQSSCEAILKLKNVVIEGVPDGADLAAQVAINPTTFGYFDGQIRGFCPTKDEEEWVVNIKKAIVSALQISSTGEESDDVIEEDFSGSCPTSFRNIEKTDSGMVIEKKKNLNRCKDRRVDLRQTPDQALGQLKELLRQYAHPMDSRLTCKLTLKDKVVSEADCEESHTIMHRQDKPLHVSNIKLSLKDTKAGIATDLAAREFDKQEIFFQHDHKHKHTSSEADIVETLKKLCQEISGKNIHIEASTTFEDLTSKLKYAADDVVSSVDEAAKSGSICPSANKRLRELFLDASAFAASDGSIKTLVNAHNNNELSISRATAAFMVVALKAAPKEDTIQALIPLIHSEKSTRPLLLGLSVLFRRYCQKTNDCASNAAVKEARDAFSSQIGKNENKLEKITLIKALENLNTNKENNENVVKLLDEIINSESANQGVRLAAVKALPDEESINEQLKSIVLKESNSNEVRIAAFQKLVRNNGVKNIGDLVGVKEHCVKNYILSFVKNIKKSKNPLRRKLLPDDVNVSEEPNTKFGITKNVAYEYGPVTLEFDVIYPKDSNVTRAINTRVSRSVDGKFVEVVEIGLRHEGLDKNVGNILNLISRKVSPSEFGFEAVRHLSELVSKLKKKDPTFNSLQVSVKVNGKNLAFTDVFEDIHAMAGLLKKRYEKIVEEKGVDRTLGGVLIDTKLIVPTVSGIPLIYKLNDNFVLQINGQVTGDSKKRNIVLNRSLIAGLQASMKLKLKDNKMGYEYDAKLAVTPLLDLDVERNDKSIVLRVNVKDVDSHTFLKFKQSLREKRSGAKEENEIENELAPEPRSDDCFSPFILNYCRKASQVKGLRIPNVEYYATKPDKEITALEWELKMDDSTADRKIFSSTYKAINSPKDTEHSVEVDVSYPANSPKEFKVMLKSPTNKMETKFSLNLDQTRNLDLKLNFPNVIDINVKGKFDRVKETNTHSNEIMVDYKFANDPTLHTFKFKNSLGYNLKRSNKEKFANFDYTSEMESSRRPILNHRTLISFKYRPLKTNEIVFDLTYGKNFDRKLKFSRISKSEVQEMNPFTMTSDTDLKIEATDFDVNYDIKSDLKLLSEKGIPKEIDMKITGKDRSKRAAETGNTDIDGKLEYRNKGPQIDQTVNGHLKIWDKDYAYESELKHVEGQKYEGKITIQTEKDKKIFITHKEEISKPTKDINLKFDADVSYSDKPDKKNYNFELKKMDNVYSLKGNVKKNGEVIFNNDLTIEKNGKMKLLLTRGPRSYDVEVDNVFRAKDIKVIFKVKDRVYNIKIDREPFKYMNLKVEGNDQAYIKMLDAHLSVLDPMFAHLLTKANTKVDFTFDPLDSNKKATLMIDSPKFNFKHDGTSELSIINPRLLLKSSTKKDDREYKLTADIARKGSLIAFERTTPERTSKVKYSRNGDKVNVDIDTTNIQGNIVGDRKSGKIHLKNTESNYELESNYRCENGKFVIESTTSNNAKLEALISRNEPSSFVFESPKVNTHFKLDVSKPRKTMEFDFDNPLYQRKSSGEFERGVMYKYSSQSKIKSSSKEHKVEINGVPLKEMNVDIDLSDFKFKITKPPTGDKVKFEYTLNDYTESEEYDFNPHRSNLVNWVLAIRKYIRSFLVD